MLRKNILKKKHCRNYNWNQKGLHTVDTFLVFEQDLIISGLAFDLVRVWSMKIHLILYFLSLPTLSNPYLIIAGVSVNKKVT